MGTIHLPKDKPIPRTLTIRFGIKTEAETEQKPS